MKINVSGLLQEATGATRSYDIDFELDTPGRPRERVSGSAEFLRTPSGILVRARVAMVEPETCSRCLKPLDEQVDISFEEEFISMLDPRTGQALTGDRDPDAFLIDEKHTLDLTEAVRQYREVCLLMAPLCREDCKGLCSVCGADLNEGNCGHDTAPVDNRWAHLADLKSAGLVGKD